MCTCVCLCEAVCVCAYVRLCVHACVSVCVYVCVRVSGVRGVGAGRLKRYTKQEEECSYAHLFLYWTELLSLKDCYHHIAKFASPFSTGVGRERLGREWEGMKGGR